MTQNKKNKKIFRWDFLSRLLAYTNKYRLVFYFCIFFTLSLSSLSIFRAFFIKDAFAKYIAIPNIEGLKTYSLLILGLIMIEALFQFLMSYWSGWLGQMIIRDLRVQIFRKINGFKTQYFDNNPVGKLVVRVVSDIEAISEIFSQGILTFVGDLVKIIFIISLMFYTNITLTIYILLLFPLLFLATRYFQKFMKKAFDAERTAIGNLGTFVQEHVQGMSIVQIFHREKQEFEKFKELNKEHRNATLQSILYFSIFLPLIEIFSALALGIVVWKGGFLILQDADLQPADIILFILLINMLFRPVRQLADRVNTIQRGLVASERIFNIIDLQEDDFDTKNPDQDFSLKGEISFSEVDFSYKEGEPILKNINLNIKNNEKVALVGSTGAGKSTIISILNRFYEIDRGTITIGNQNIKELPKQKLRSKIATVQQDVFLFSGSILYNLQLGNSFTEEEIYQAAKEIGIYEYFTKLPNGFHFEVSERGNMLSVGQRQLIAFLRAYLYNPDILILDEATASIDTVTEQYIQQAFELIAKDRTTIVVAHRLSTIKNAHKIVVLDKGEIKETGNHQELLEIEHGIYKNLYSMQFSKN
jgi:subfamily B ATP-binding cassette protein MsbA